MQVVLQLHLLLNQEDANVQKTSPFQVNVNFVKFAKKIFADLVSFARKILKQSTFTSKIQKKVLFCIKILSQSFP